MNRPRLCLLSAAILAYWLPAAHGAELRRAYLDAQQRVHIVTVDGSDRRVSGKRGIDLTLSPDRNALVWLAVATRGDMASSDLRLYSAGRVHRLGNGVEVRAFQFVRDGRQLAIRFAEPGRPGRQELYDIDTVAAVDSFDEADRQRRRRPSWALAD